MALARLVSKARMCALMAPRRGLPQPHACLRRHCQLGACSLARFIYCSTFPHRPFSTTPTESGLPVHDEKAIQDTFEGFLLMSLLKYVYLLPIISRPFLGPSTRIDLTLGLMASLPYRTSTLQKLRCASSPTAVLRPARPTYLRILPRILAPIMSSQSSLSPPTFSLCDQLTGSA
jgi:hypothetical protein